MLSSTKLDTERDDTSVDLGRTVRRGATAWVLLTATLLLLGGLGRWVVFDGAPGDAEADFTGWIADNRVGALDQAATIGSTLTDTWTVIGVVIGSVTVLLATGQLRAAGVVLVAMGLELGSFFLVGALIDRSRPEAEALHSTPSTPSFPSGHVAAAIVVYGSLVLVAHIVAEPGRVPRLVWIAPVVIAVVVAVSRVYEGVHFPTDVIAGAILGVGALYGAAFTMGFADGIGSRRGERG